MVEAADTSEMMVNFYQTTQYNNPENGHLHTLCCDNLKTHSVMAKFRTTKMLNSVF
jgi:hypothetical protein